MKTNRSLSKQENRFRTLARSMIQNKITDIDSVLSIIKEIELKNRIILEVLKSPLLSDLGIKKYEN